MGIFNLLLSVINVAVICAEWSYYGNNGPNYWGSKYPICNKDRQSPVNIEEGDVVPDNRLSAFRFHGYDNALENLTVWNDGYTVTVRVHGNLHIEEGGLPGAYSLEHFHFHWGSNNDVGSEHLVNGESYPLEMHLVHKSKRHKKISAALADPTGLAVLGVFFKLGSHHPYLQTIIDGLENLDIGDWSNITPFALRNLLPSDVGTFYRYQGSLTTPPCSESVVWTVFKQPIEMSEPQMDRIRGLSIISKITDNYRPVQSLNGRMIYVRNGQGEYGGKIVPNTAVAAADISENPTDSVAGSTTTSPSGISLFMGALMALLFIR